MSPRAADDSLPAAAFSRREQQVMDILYRRGSATVAQVMADVPDPPSYSAVRSILRILGQKGAIRHTRDGPRYVYAPAEPAESAREHALEHLVRTFFGGSPERAVKALLRMADRETCADEIARHREAIRRVPDEGSGGHRRGR